MPENEWKHDRRRILEATIFVFEGLLQKMAEPDIAEKEEPPSDMLAIIRPSAVFSKGCIKGWVGKSDRKHMLRTVFLDKVSDHDRDWPAWMLKSQYSGRIALARRRPSCIGKNVV